MSLFWNLLWTLQHRKKKVRKFKVIISRSAFYSSENIFMFVYNQLLQKTDFNDFFVIWGYLINDLLLLLSNKFWKIWQLGVTFSDPFLWSKNSISLMCDEFRFTLFPPACIDVRRIVPHSHWMDLTYVSYYYYTMLI